MRGIKGRNLFDAFFFQRGHRRQADSMIGFLLSQKKGTRFRFDEDVSA